MPIEVEVPEVGIVEFPDGMKPEEIRSVLQKKFPKDENKAVRDTFSNIKTDPFNQGVFQPTELTPTSEFTQELANRLPQDLGRAAGLVSKGANKAAEVLLSELPQRLAGRTGDEVEHVNMEDVSPIPAPSPNAKGVGPSLQRFGHGMLTPGQALLLGAAPESKALQAVFLGGAGSGAAEAAKALVRSEKPDEMKGAATDLALSLGMGGLMAKGLMGEGKAAEAVKTKPQTDTGIALPKMESETPIPKVEATPKETVASPGNIEVAPPAGYKYYSPLRPTASISQGLPKDWQAIDERTFSVSKPLPNDLMARLELEPLDPTHPVNIKKEYDRFADSIRSLTGDSDTIKATLKDGQTLIASPNVDPSESGRYPFRVTRLLKDGTPAGHETFFDYDEVIRRLWGSKNDIQKLEAAKPAESVPAATVPAPTPKTETSPSSDLIGRAIALSRNIGSTPTEGFAKAIDAARSGEAGPLTKMVSDMEAKLKEMNKPPVSRGFRLKERFDQETEAVGNDLLDWIRENMPLMSKGKARKIYGEEKFKLNQSEWDGAPEKLSAPHHNLIYAGEEVTREGKKVPSPGNAPDRVAQAAFEAGKLKAPDVNLLWQEIVAASKKRAGAGKGAAREGKFLNQDAAFAEETSEGKGKAPVPVQRLSVGETLQVGGEKFDVTKVDADTGDVTIKDGTKFGSQTLKDGSQIWVENYEEAQGSEVPEFVGMGGAAPYEFQPRENSPTGVKNRIVDQERVRRGLPPTMAPLRQSAPALWDRVMDRIDNDPGWRDRLVGELQDNPRPIDAEEHFALQHYWIDLQNEYARALERINQAYGSQADLVPEFQEQAAMWRDRIEQFTDMTRKVGTIAGRSLGARRFVFNRDFTLAGMEMDLRAARNGAPVTDAERVELQETKKKLDELQKSSQDAEAAWRQRLSEMEAERNIAQQRAAAAAQPPPFDRRVLSRAEEIVSGWEKAATDAQQRARERLSRLSVGIDPTIIADLALVGRAKIGRMALDFARFTDEMVRDFGERVRPVMQEVWDRSNQLLEQSLRQLDEPIRRAVRGSGRRARTFAQDIEETGDRIQNAVERGEMDGMFPLVQRLVRTIVQRSINITRDALVDEVWDILKTALPDITRRDAMDAISGYGRFTPLRQDDLSVRVRDLKGQLQQVAKLEDIQARIPPRKSGLERRTPSDEERRQIQLVNEAKRRYGVRITDPATQLKSALDARKTAMRNQISDLDYQIRSQQRIVREKTPPPSDAELEGLRNRRNELKSQFDEIFGRPELTDAQRAEREAARLEREIAEVERQLKEGDIFFERKTQTKPLTPQIEAQRSRLNALKSERQYLREAIQPKEVRTPEEKAIAAYKARLEREIADKTERMAKGDFAPRVRRPLPEMPPSVRKLKAEAEKVRQDWEKRLVEERLKNRTPLQKLSDTIVKWRQSFVISGLKSILKLAAASVEGMLILPLREASGVVMGKLPVLRGVAAKAPREGGGSVEIEAKAAADMWNNLIADFGKNLKGQKPDFERIYGGRENLPPELQNYVGFLHGALKGPLARSEWRRSYEKRRAFAAKQGLDVTDPLVDMEVGRQAWEDSQFWKFQNRNLVASMFRQAIARLQAVKGGKGFIPKVAATVARLEFPVVTVPSNIVARVMESIGGVPLGAGRLIYRAMQHRGFKEAINSLSNEEADLIMRNLKTGSIGAAFGLLGFLSPQFFGGYYQPGWKKKAGDAEFGAIQIPGIGAQVPSFLLHNPFLESAQFGATMRRIADSKLRKKDKETQGLWIGLYGATTAAMESQPFVRESIEIAKAENPTERERFIGEHLRSYLIPMAVQNLAEWLDKNKQGGLVKRKPRTVGEYMKVGVPWLRETVPQGKPK